ncbi:hypothetical protein SO802_021056 [Lithocarpus litseifolius]|uniref:Uncharacterized protein n=1 Tax=Lithocarpus litseifolius TaxID=425828 RepID=A0AAW2CH86_9ROSI
MSHDPKGILTMELWSKMEMVALMVGEGMEVEVKAMEEVAAILGMGGAIIAVGLFNRISAVIIIMEVGQLLHKAAISFNS